MTSNFEYVGFSEATWKVTSNLDLVAGVRYFTETLNGVQEQTHAFGGFSPGPTLVPVIDTTSTFLWNPTRCSTCGLGYRQSLGV